MAIVVAIALLRNPNHTHDNMNAVKKGDLELFIMDDVSVFTLWSRNLCVNFKF